MSVEQINITLGTAGHIDHGKTALIKLLTGCDTDRLKAEKERGMSIELGFAPCRIAGTDGHDPLEPPVGQCFFYLVTAANRYYESTLGNDSGATPRVKGTPCP